MKARLPRFGPATVCTLPPSSSLSRIVILSAGAQLLRTGVEGSAVPGQWNDLPAAGKPRIPRLRSYAAPVGMTIPFVAAPANENGAFKCIPKQKWRQDISHGARRDNFKPRVYS